MESVVQRCAGIDIGKADLKACIRTPGPRGGRRHEVRTFATTTSGLLQLRDWLSAEGVTRVGMEATGVYWKPVYYMLEGGFDTHCSTPDTCTTCPAARPTCPMPPGSPS
jgi:transposase